MHRRKKQAIVPEQKAFKVTINTSAFQHHKNPLKERTQEEYIPKYWQKCHMDQKKISNGRQDRLSQLTTTQIDRIIDMEKIRSLLYDKKRKIQDKYFDYDQCDTSAHSNIYQANFLAKINEIAIKRNIKHESTGFDEFKKTYSNSVNEKDSTMAVPYKYIKQYVTDRRKKSVKKSNKEEEQEKSIQSIQADIDDFEVKLEDRKTSNFLKIKERKSERKQYKLLPSNRWFYGMSTYYIEKGIDRPSERKSQCYRSIYDIESEPRDIPSRKPSRKGFRTTNYSTHSCRQRSERSERTSTEPMSQFKTTRVVTLDS